MRSCKTNKTSHITKREVHPKLQTKFIVENCFVIVMTVSSTRHITVPNLGIYQMFLSRSSAALSCGFKTSENHSITSRLLYTIF